MHVDLIARNVSQAGTNVFPGQVLGFDMPTGRAVGYKEPLYTNPLERTSQAIRRSQTLESFESRTYRFRSNGHYIREMIPGREYYKIAIRRLRNSLHSTLVARRRIDQDLRAIEQTRPEIVTKDGCEQPRVSFDTELYELRTDLSAYVSLVRASLDILATVAQTVYGRETKPFSSIRDLYKFLQKPVGESIDPNLVLRLEEHGQWLWLLRDVRDYIAHYGALQFSLFLDENDSISVYIFRSMEATSFVDMIDRELASFLEFVDKNWSSVVRGRDAQP